MRRYPVIALLLLLAGPGWAEPADVQPLRIIRTVEPRFPDLLSRRGVYEGEARVVVHIDAEGRLADWLLTSYSHPFFGREATEVLRQWRFEPARRNGEAIGVRTEMVFGFQTSGMVISVTTGDLMERLHRRGNQTAVHRVSQPHELDEPIAALQRVAPLWPEDFTPAEREARVTVDFYIDEEGRPRMPVVVQSDDEALNFAAIEAISHWRFAPPLRQGAPVMVRARQSFRFFRRT